MFNLQDRTGVPAFQLSIALALVVQHPLAKDDGDSGVAALRFMLLVHALEYGGTLRLSISLEGFITTFRSSDFVVELIQKTGSNLEKKTSVPAWCTS